MSKVNEFLKKGPDEPWTGLKCGCTRPRAEFYARDPWKCKTCRTLDEKERKRSKQKEDTLILTDSDNGAAKDAMPSGQGYKYRCEVHGPHDGWRLGGTATDQCPLCVRARRLEAVRRSRSRRQALLVTVPAWAAEWMREQAEKEGCADVDAWARRMLLGEIPAEYVKEKFIAAGV